MNRKEVIILSKLAACGKLTRNDAETLLTQYCLEYNKPYDKTAIFVDIVLSIGELSRYCIQEALTYYEKKFTICKLYSAPVSLNYNSGETRNILQIF